MTRTRFLIVNPTCLSLLNRHREWLQSQGIDAVAGATDDAGNGAAGFQEIRHLNRDFDALIGPGTAPLMFDDVIASVAGRLKVVALASSGHEWVDVQSATRRGIVVTHAPMASLGEVVADLTWGLLLAVARQIPTHHLRLRCGDAERGMGAMVWGRTLGIVGLGNIGQKVARRARGFEMRILAAETCPDGAFCARNSISVVDLDDLLRQSDFVSLHLRLDASTRGIIGAHELGLMKPGAYLINTARPGLVDEDALVHAILERRIAGAALDDAPQGAAKSLLHLPSVVLTPHIGNRVLDSADSVCRQAYTTALDVVQGRMPETRYVLNPEVFQQQRNDTSAA